MLCHLFGWLKVKSTGLSQRPICSFTKWGKVGPGLLIHSPLKIYRLL
jgi:hypothetical protein